MEMGLADARVMCCSFLGSERGTPSVVMKAMRNELIAKEMGSCRCVGMAVRDWE
jgi:hypothetical protein